MAAKRPNQHEKVPNLRPPRTRDSSPEISYQIMVKMLLWQKLNPKEALGGL